MIRRLAALVAALLPLAASAAPWTTNDPVQYQTALYDQSFTIPIDSVGDSAPDHQDLQSCPQSVIATLIGAGAVVSVYDCPGADSDRSSCTRVLDIDTEGVNPHPIKFTRGFALSRVSIAAVAGTLTLQCTDIPNETFDGSAWVETHPVNPYEGGVFHFPVDDNPITDSEGEAAIKRNHYFAGVDALQLFDGVGDAWVVHASDVPGDNEAPVFKASNGLTFWKKVLLNSLSVNVVNGWLCLGPSPWTACATGANSRWELDVNGNITGWGEIRADTFVLPSTGTFNAWMAFGDGTETYFQFLSDSGTSFIDGNLSMLERSSDAGLGANHGTFWVKDDSPTTGWFTDSAGSTFRVGALQGNCTVQPCLDGSADGGTEFSLYDATAFKGTFKLKPGILGADATFQLLDNNQALSEVNLRIPVMNHSTIIQVWQGAQRFTNTATGTRISLLNTPLIKGITTGSITIGDNDGAGGDDNPRIFFNATESVEITTDAGTSVFDGISVDFQEAAVGPTPGSSHGAFWVLDDTVDWPAFTDETNTDHILASLSREQAWTAAQEFQDDLFYTGDDSGIPYGSMYNHDTPTTVNIVALNTATQIPSGFSQGEVHLTAFGNSREITVTEAGRYAITWQISFTTAAANQEIEGGVMVGGVADLTITAHRRISTATDTGSMSATGILDLAASDVVSLFVLNETSSTVDVNIEHANMTVTMDGGT